MTLPQILLDRDFRILKRNPEAIHNYPLLQNLRDLLTPEQMEQVRTAAEKGRCRNLDLYIDNRRYILDFYPVKEGVIKLIPQDSFLYDRTESPIPTSLAEMLRHDAQLPLAKIHRTLRARFATEKAISNREYRTIEEQVCRLTDFYRALQNRLETPQPVQDFTHISGSLEDWCRLTQVRMEAEHSDRYLFLSRLQFHYLLFTLYLFLLEHGVGRKSFTLKAHIRQDQQMELCFHTGKISDPETWLKDFEKPLPLAASLQDVSLFCAREYLAYQDGHMELQFRYSTLRLHVTLPTRHLTVMEASPAEPLTETYADILAQIAKLENNL